FGFRQGEAPSARPIVICSAVAQDYGVRWRDTPLDLAKLSSKAVCRATALQRCYSTPKSPLLQAADQSGQSVGNGGGIRKSTAVVVEPHQPVGGAYKRAC